MIRRYVLNILEVLKKLEEFKRKISYARKTNLGELKNISLEEELED
jgi:hypothetical protein